MTRKNLLTNLKHVDRAWPDVVHVDRYVTLIVMMSCEKEILRDILTLTFPFNVLIGHQKKTVTFTFTLNLLIGQLNSHMTELFAYLTNSECLLCNSHCGPRLAKQNRPLEGNKWNYNDIKDVAQCERPLTEIKFNNMN